MEGRTQEAAEELIDKALTPRQQRSVCAVAMDMWAPYMQAVAGKLEGADIVHDKFHIAKHLTDAVDKVRRVENRELRKADDDSLKGTRYLWLRNRENIKTERRASFAELCSSTLKTARAWQLKELFRSFWGFIYPKDAERFFRRWYGRAIRSRLDPVKRVARMLKKHLPGILAYFECYITNAQTEGTNSMIQTEIDNARGFGSFEGIRTAVLFRYGDLEMAP